MKYLLIILISIITISCTNVYTTDYGSCVIYTKKKQVSKNIND
jgi:hypothetical protein